MKKVPIFLLKTSFLIAFCCLVLLNIGHAQAEMSLWYIPDIPFSQSGQEHHPNSVEIPCDWNYYHRSDGKDKIIEYGIKNEGDAPLTLTLPLAFEHNAINFQIVEQPSKTMLAPGEDIHFKIRYIDTEKSGSLTAELPILSNDSNRSICTIRFRVGGFFLDPLPEEVHCFTEYIKTSDYGTELTPRDIQTITRTLDEHNNVLEEREVLTNESGDVLGEFIATSTYNSQNQPLTYKEVYLAGYKGFLCDEMITNTYDSNGNLIEEVVLTNTLVGVYNATHNYTYNSSNLVIQDLITYSNPFVSNGIYTINYTYDANGNLLAVNENDFDGDAYSKTNTYDTYNNLLTCEEISNGSLIYSISNTYDSNNNLVTSVEAFRFGGATYSYTYDENNNISIIQIERMLDPFGLFTVLETITYTYNRFQSLVKQETLTEIGHLPNRTSKSTRVLTYDSNNRLTGILLEVFIGDDTNSAFTEQISITPCDIPKPSIADPCTCSDPLNKSDNSGRITHFHDVLSVDGTSGDEVILQTGNINFLDNNLAQLANGTILGTIPASGTLEFDFFHAPEVAGAITLQVGGVLSDPFDISVCSAINCVTIPTMSQWGLLIFGLLILNLSIFSIYRLRLV